MSTFQKLNENQQKAILTEHQHVRIIAGAGSGKTRVLTERIAYLIETIGVYANRIIGFTFTNKAAEEMLNRVKKLLNDDVVTVRLSTFHSFGARFLREEIYRLNIITGFIIYDDEDTKTLIRNICVARGHEKRGEMSSEAIAFIGSVKEKGLDAFTYKPRTFSHGNENELVEIWKEYERRLFAMGCLDFNDLISKTIIILEDFPDAREKWRSRFDHILVDEFQDTNDQQYKLIKLLKHPGTSLYVVGDPDQTIYTWRGAKEEIILNFNRDYPDTETITLDQNYRSTTHILDAANKLIAHNRNRIPKNLFTEVGQGEPVITKGLRSAEEEAKWVYQQIANLKLNSNDFSYGQVAILMRSNYLTLPFEQLFVMEGLPYEIYGGLKFYQRAEIKDILAYLRLLMNEKDDVSFERIVNTPRRGVGEVALEKIKIAALRNEFSLLETIRYGQDLDLSPAVEAALKEVVSAIDITRTKIKEDNLALSVIINDYIKQVGYFNHILKEKDPERQETMSSNIQTLVASINDFQNNNPDATFATYLENVALHSSQDDVRNGEFVTLMTVHMAKGLEYDYIFVVGMNEGVFPNHRAVSDSGTKGHEEERRLAYVAMTRAKRRLYISFHTGYSFINHDNGIASSFISEAGLSAPRFKPYDQKYGTPKREKKPPEYKQNSDVPQYNRNFFEYDYSSDFAYAVNDVVIHTSFGSGIVIATDPSSAIITVRFDNEEVKKLKVPNKFISKG